MFFKNANFLKLARKMVVPIYVNVKIGASISYKLVGTWKNPVNYRSLVSTGLLIATKIKFMRQISTLFFCLILLFSTVNAQDSSNSNIQGLKIPGSTSNTEPVIIKLRCGYSNSYTEPLIVIDGLVAEKFELKNIEPDDIESIWVLKDHTATALYGCRAMSGVITITTKTANDRTIGVKDMLTGEILANANVDLISVEERKDTTHLNTDSSGKIVTNKIVYGKEYELITTCVGYKPYRCLINSKTVGKSYKVLLLKDFKTLSITENKEQILQQQMCLPFKTDQSNRLISATKVGINQFKIFPNPTKAGSQIKIEWKAPAGDYAIDLYNLQGQLIKSSLAIVENETNLLSFQIPTITPGSYLLQMTNKKSGKKHTEKIIIR